MKRYDYLIVGGGMTASAAAKGIRDVDGSGTIGVISAEKVSPYDRPPLSKKLWTEDKELESVFHELPSDVELHSGRFAERLDPEEKTITDDQGIEYAYNSLLLATGSSPRRLPFGADHIIYYRTVEDYRHLRQLSDSHSRFAVIGGGFIGSEISAALAMEGKQVTIIFPNEGIGSNVFPSDIASHLNGYYRQKGVEVLNGTRAVDLNGTGADLTVITDDGRSLTVHGVVAGIGVSPNVSLAEEAGLAVDDGILVDSRLQTSDPHIFASGDVANFPDQLLGYRRRVEHEDAANSMGEAAGRIMAGADETYDYSPMFYSDLFDLGYEAVGVLNPDLETIADWQEPYRKGILYYLRDNRINGVLLWNVWDKVEDARALIASDREISPSNVTGLLG